MPWGERTLGSSTALQTVLREACLALFLLLLKVLITDQSKGIMWELIRMQHLRLHCRPPESECVLTGDSGNSKAHQVSKVRQWDRNPKSFHSLNLSTWPKGMRWPSWSSKAVLERQCGVKDPAALNDLPFLLFMPLGSPFRQWGGLCGKSNV